MRVLAIDPGPHVGVAFFTSSGTSESFDCWEEQPERFYEMADGWVSGLSPKVGAPGRVVIESFHITGTRAKEANETIEMIGVVRYLCERYGVELFEQSPADAKMFGSATKMKRLGWWRTGSDHQQSAARHLMLHCAKHNLIDARRLLPRDKV